MRPMERFARFVAVLILTLVPFAAFAVPADREGPHHVILTPVRALTDADRAALAAEGIEIERALTGGRFVARVEAGAAAASDSRIASMRALSLRDKIHASAWRTVASGRPFSRVRIFFQNDVSFDEARAAVEAAGGSTDDPLATRLEPLHSLVARIPSTSLEDLASDDSVLVVYGARNFRATSWNAGAALLSHVSDVQASPYSLSGNGVVLTYFELGTAYAAHPEFGGRLSVANFSCAASDTECNNSDNKTHATHVGGTMIAAGIDPRAKGMAPAATLSEFRANDGTWLDQKANTIKALGSVADNNSWGYVLGWSSDTSNNWTWNEGEELIGGYSADINSVFDHIASTNGAIGIYSAGNDASEYGPTVAPYLHHHVDSQGNQTTPVYCYSTDLTGNDCPTSLGCTAGSQYCEIVRHPTHAANGLSSPGGSIGWTASSKNTIAVGSTNSSLFISNFSSRGPTKDGRIKPEITAKGQSLYSTALSGTYTTLQGTSMAAPVVTGTMALLVEQWRKLNGGASPLPVTLKALAIAGADDLGNPGPDYTYGFGFLNAKASVDLIVADAGTGKRVRIGSASQGSVDNYPVTLSAQENFRVVLTWFDPEALPLGSEDVAGKTLINDLDVEVVDPTGATVLPYVLDPANPGANATRGVNTIDNTEEVEIANAVAGTYHVVVSGTTVPKGPQQYVLVANADVGTPAAPCTDGTEPNDTTATAYPLAIARPVDAAICVGSDVDYFDFATADAGAVSVAVTARATPLKATLLLNGTTLSTINVAAGATQDLATFAGSSSAQYFVRVEPQGTLGSSGDYTITATYPYTSPPRRRGARH